MDERLQKIRSVYLMAECLNFMTTHSYTNNRSIQLLNFFAFGSVVNSPYSIAMSSAEIWYHRLKVNLIGYKIYNKNQIKSIFLKLPQKAEHQIVSFHVNFILTTIKKLKCGNGKRAKRVTFIRSEIGKWHLGWKRKRDQKFFTSVSWWSLVVKR